MKKNKKLIGISILLIGILTLSIVTVNLIKSRGNSDTEWINFAIEDTTKITKIIIEDTYGQYIELIQEDGVWHDEKGECVSKPNVSFILEAAKLIEFKGYLPEKSKPKFTELMATQHIKVSYYVDGEWTKSWYIGPPAQDHYGQIMLLETANDGKSKDPVMMRIKGLNGIISPRFFAERKRWMCTSIFELAPEEIRLQLEDNIQWIKEAKKNKLVVGSQARILYADAEGRMRIAKAFNEAIARKEIGPVILGRDHHDVSGTDSPYRETSNIYDGSRFTSDMAIQNVIGDSFRGATWVSIHNGGGVGWGEVINGGFGLLLDGSARADQNVTSMLHWDVNNGIARRNWARNENATFAIKRAMEAEPLLKVTLPNLVDDQLLEDLF